MSAPYRACRRAPCRWSSIVAGAIALVTVAVADTDRARAQEAPPVDVTTPVAVSDAAQMAAFLDRLVQVESGGRDTAKNPRSTALGAFQFIESTFIEIARRHFQAETASLTNAQLLALRTDRAFARRAAEVLTRENIGVLVGSSVVPTFANLRLAYLVGPAATVRLVKGEAAAPVIGVLGAAVVQANPFMAGMVARDLLAWSERNMAAGATALAAMPLPPAPGSAEAALASRDAGPGPSPAAMAVPASIPTPPKPARPAIRVACNLGLASCRRWLALAEKSARRQQVVAARPTRRTTAR